MQPAAPDVKQGPVPRPPTLWLFVVLASVLLGLVCSGGVARAQPPMTVTSGERAEEEAADSPRASMRSFFDLCERSRYQEASIYLDLPSGNEKRAAELASKLYTVLSQRLLIIVEALSGAAEGRQTDGLPPGIEELGKITDAKGRPVRIRLVRHEPKSSADEPRWVFSQTTVSAVPALYGSLRDSWIRERLPPSLLWQGPMALYYWQWLALPLLAGLCFGAGRLLTFLSGILARRLLAQRSWSERLLSGLKSPARLGWALAAFAIAMPFLALTLRAEDLLERGLSALAYLTFFWALLRVVIVVGDEIAHADWTRSRPSARSLSAVGVSAGKVIVAALALMVALSELGYPVTSVIAGLGIGGVALALAAQKTVENLFGSISILADQPFRVGDTIRVDTIEGTVERIGLRSTRVRTADRTVVIFANGKLADMRIESLGPRDRMRFATKIQLSRASSMAHVRSVVFELKDKLASTPLVRKEEIFVRLSAIGEASWDIDIAAPIDTLDSDEFARIREELLMATVDIVDKAGAELALPVRQLVAAGPGANGANGANGQQTPASPVAPGDGQQPTEPVGGRS